MLDLTIFLDWPSTHNTLVVLLSVLVMGAACTAVGCFAVLNKQALISDVASHATVPGLAIGFLLTVLLRTESDVFAMGLMLLCAGVSGAFGVFLVGWVSRCSRLRPDAAMGAVLSVFYGLGLVLFSMIQRIEGVSAAGLDRFLLGQVTGITVAEGVMIAVLSLVALGGVVLSFRGLTWLCFDPLYLQAHYPRLKIVMNRILIGLILVVICAGLRTVGIVLFVALMIIPVCSLRIWCRRVSSLAIGSGFLGLLSCYIGVQVSAHYADVPAGAAIVLACAFVFVVSIGLANLLRIGRV